METCVQAFTRFLLLGHAFHGGGVVATAKNSFTVLKKHLGQALVTDSIAVQVVSWSVGIFSVGIRFLGLIWMEESVGNGVLFPKEVACDPMLPYGCAQPVPQVHLWTLVFSLAFLLLSKYPLVTLILVFGFVHPLMHSEEILGLYCGIFMTCLTSIIFHFVGEIVHNATDVIMYCMALEQEAGKPQKRFADIYAVMKEATGAAEDPVIAQGEMVREP